MIFNNDIDDEYGASDHMVAFFKILILGKLIKKHGFKRKTTPILRSAFWVNVSTGKNSLEIEYDI